MGSMEVLNETLTNESSTWQYLFYDLADPRTRDWFLVGNPIPLFVILGSYLYFVKVCGPNYMKDKKPYKLKRAIQVYNLFQIAFNTWLFSEAIRMWSGYNWNCQPVDRSYSPTALKNTWGVYMYYINKLTDLTDTVFFVLRKKNNQISFLHVFHHAIMAGNMWFVTTYLPGGHGTFTGLPNTFVHIILYGYYFLASLGPEIQKYLWWKKYITQIQLIQFVMIFIHQFQLFIFDCDYPTAFGFISLPNAIFFFYLFSDFYKKSYGKKPATSTENSIKTK